jgi:tryptophanase
VVSVACNVSANARGRCARVDLKQDDRAAAVVHAVFLDARRILCTQAHVDVVARSMIEVFENAATIRGLRFAYGPERLRRFLGRFEPVA